MYVWIFSFVQIEFTGVSVRDAFKLHVIGQHFECLFAQALFDDMQCKFFFFRLNIVISFYFFQLYSLTTRCCGRSKIYTWMCHVDFTSLLLLLLFIPKKKFVFIKIFYFFIFYSAIIAIVFCLNMTNCCQCSLSRILFVCWFL